MSIVTFFQAAIPAQSFRSPYEWNEFDPKEVVRKYPQFVYETGAMDTGKVYGVAVFNRVNVGWGCGGGVFDEEVE